MTRTATAVRQQQRLDAAQAWAEVEARRITLVPILDGRIWHASVERVKKARKRGRDDMEVVSATASMSVDAVFALIEKLDSEPGPQLWLDA
jgi:hypothetical protein